MVVEGVGLGDAFIRHGRVAGAEVDRLAAEDLAQRVLAGEEELDAVAFMKLIKEKAEMVQLPQKLLKRSVNSGFSGGEKKRNEILQMALLEPSLAILDETDSGLDIDALRVVADGVNALRSPDRAMIVVTHYQPRACWRPQPLSPARALLALMDNTVAARREPEYSMPILRKVAMAARRAGVP